MAHEQAHEPITSRPHVSCLCVTEGRAAFMPWLLWCFDRQHYAERELVIVDSSPTPFALDTNSGVHPNVRVVDAPPGSSVAHKRNLALRAAQGDVITWFDDDDWQHPQKLEWLVEALSGGAPYAGARRAWFVNLLSRQCTPFGGPRQAIIFNSAAFVRQAVTGVEFPEHVRVASDTRWMQALQAQADGRAAVVARDDLFFWLCHAQNLSNPAHRRRFTHTLDALKAQIGADAWGDTDVALDALQARLAAAHPVGGTTPARISPARKPPERITPVRKTPERKTPERRVSASVSAPMRGSAAEEVRTDAERRSTADHDIPVSVMIKATVLDAPYLATMVRHMLAQARFDFVERAIIVDRPRAFAGKYRDRTRASDDDLDRVLAQLLAEGVIDQVRAVDTTPAVVQRVQERYFGASAAQVPTHAITGGPIYATLFGLESMPTDMVLQMDADVFFYSDAESWVQQALACMRRDPRLWLMMTHPGPPAGAPGHSLTGHNAQRGLWDPALAIWRFRTATTRYFLCDRRALHQRLLPVPMQGGCAPLEQCISAALQRHGAMRGNLGSLHSWHLHGWSHSEPFPTWAPQIAAAVAAGRVPALQRGAYDLRLDRAQDRQAWQQLLAQDERVPAAARHTPVLQPTRVAARENGTAPVQTAPTHTAIMPMPQAASGAPIAVILPVRDRAGQRLRNALHSLQWQTSGRPAQVIVVSHGSQPRIDQELAQICRAAGATLLTTGTPEQPWNKPLALNMGIRATSPDVTFLMTMDIDMILAPNFVQVVLQHLQGDARALVLCQSADLPETQRVPADHQQLLAAFPQLQRTCRLRAHTGTGGIQAAQRDFFYEIRGYDEDLLWWGAMDGDIVTRAKLLGLQIVWIEAQTAMLHQWHPRKHAGLAKHSHMVAARQAWQRNHELVAARSRQVQRNPHGWGGVPD